MSDLSLRTIAREIIEQSLLDFLMAPATRLLILLQTQDKTHVTAPGQKTDIWHYLTTIYRQEGLSGLWRGNLVETVKNSIFRVLNTVVLKLYEPIFLPKRLENTNADTSLREFFLVFAVECSTLLVQHPLKVIRIKLASAPVEQDKVTSKKFLGLRRIYACAKEIWDQEGYKGFYKGVSISAVQTLSTLGLLLVEKGIVSVMRPNIASKTSLVKDAAQSRAPAGMLASVVTGPNTVNDYKADAKKTIFKAIFSALQTLVLYPYSVLQARVIAGDEELPVDQAEQVLYYVKVAQAIYEKEGIKGFYRGLSVGAFNTVTATLLQPTVGLTAKGIARVIVGGDKKKK